MSWLLRSHIVRFWIRFYNLYCDLCSQLHSTIVRCLDQVPKYFVISEKICNFQLNRLSHKQLSLVITKHWPKSEKLCHVKDLIGLSVKTCPVFSFGKPEHPSGRPINLTVNTAGSCAASTRFLSSPSGPAKFSEVRQGRWNGDELEAVGLARKILAL